MTRMRSRDTARATVDSAIEALRSISAAEYEQHLADGDVLVSAMTTDQRARWGALMERLQPLNEVWIGGFDVDDCDDWHRVVLALMRDRDEARATASRERAMLAHARQEIAKANNVGFEGGRDDDHDD